MANIELDRTKIKTCTKSNIVESWALLMGAGYTVNPIEIRDHIGTVTVRASKQEQLKGFVEDSTLVVHPSKGLISRPFWMKQFRWDGGKRLARVGQRYISVHRICSIPEDRYTSFDTEILNPLFDGWIPVYTDSTIQKEDLDISRIAVGYTNRFVFPSKTFSLQKYFNFLIRLNISPKERNVNPGPLNCTFQLLGATPDAISILTISAFQPNREREELCIQTTVQSEKPLKELIPLGNRDLLNAAIREVQKEAKLNFYGFCTDYNLSEVLGAR